MDNRTPPEPKRPREPRRSNGSTTTPTPPWLWLLLVSIIGLIIYMTKPEKGSVSYDWFLDQVEQNNIKSVLIQGNEVRGELRKETPYDLTDSKSERLTSFKTSFPSEHQIQPVLDQFAVYKEEKQGEPVRIEVDSSQGSSSLLWFTFLLPTLLFFGLLYLMMAAPRSVRRRHPRQFRQKPGQAAR